MLPHLFFYLSSFDSSSIILFTSPRPVCLSTSSLQTTLTYHGPIPSPRNPFRFRHCSSRVLFALQWLVYSLFPRCLRCVFSVCVFRNCALSDLHMCRELTRSPFSVVLFKLDALSLLTAVPMRSILRPSLSMRSFLPSPPSVRCHSHLVARFRPRSHFSG